MSQVGPWGPTIFLCCITVAVPFDDGRAIITKCTPKRTRPSHAGETGAPMNCTENNDSVRLLLLCRYGRRFDNNLHGAVIETAFRQQVRVERAILSDSLTVQRSNKA